MLAPPRRTNFRTWDQIATNEFDPLTDNPFTAYSPILQEIEANPAAAYDRMWENFEDAVTNYTKESINSIFLSNLTANKKKYDELIDFYKETFYPFSDYYKNEQYDHTRTPNLTSTSTSTGSGTATNERKQTTTRTTTPNNYQTVVTHKVDPFDQSGLRNQSQDISVESGSTSTTESFSGQPDETTTSSESSSTVTTTGTETNGYRKIIHGRTGQRPTSEVVADGLKAAAMHNILDVIINDIADQIFLQVWL